MIEIDESLASAKVWKVTDKGVYIVKVSFPDIDWHIQGITVQKSKFPNQPLWVQLPSYDPGTGKRFWPIECAKDSLFKITIDELAREAVEQYKTSGKHKSTSQDEVYKPTDSELENIDEELGRAIDDYESGQSP